MEELLSHPDQETHLNFSPKEITTKVTTGIPLTTEEIAYIVNGYTNGSISDDSMTDWLKAVFEKGMSHRETLDYTRTMLDSGATLNFNHLNGFVVDKHSTGGVGDKISIVLAPLLAACGCIVPMIAGRGLGHTQGTIDKLETIPGYKADLSLDTFQQNVEKIGVSIIAQTGQICPADRKIYALRDITNTVASNPLICGSIMSKKIAEGIQGLVMYVKVGQGAFMKNISQAKALGNLLQEVGELYGIKVAICYTDMNQPLGKKSGLFNEIEESIDCLKGEGPDDVMKVVYHLGKQALLQQGDRNPLDTMKSAIYNGRAFEKFREIVIAHDGYLTSLKTKSLHTPTCQFSVKSPETGVIQSIDTLALGKAIVQLGGGRIQKTDVIDPTAGFTIYKKIGESVEEGEVVIEFYCSTNSKLEKVIKDSNDLFRVNNETPPEHPLIIS